MNTKMIGNIILSTDNKHKGIVKTICYNRYCGCEDCLGDILYVKWDDGRKSYPCSAGLEHVSGRKWKIL